MPRPKRAARKCRLTEFGIKKLKPEAAAYVIWDTLQRGLAIRVQPSGAKAWKTIYSYHSRPRWLHLGDVGAIGLADARTLAAEAMLAVAKGKDPQAEKKAERGAGTFAELAEKYLTDHAKKNNKSWRQGDRLVRHYALKRWAKLQASTITRADVKAMLKHITAPILQNQVLAAVSAIFTWAVTEEILPANPCKLVARNKTKSRERVLADSELPRFWSAFGEAGLHGTALKAILLLGQRPGEVAHMRREHIVDGWWEMPGAPVPALGWPGTKNGQSHRVWVPQPAWAVIEDLSNGATTGFVFSTSRGRPVMRLDTVMRDICRQLGVERGAKPHDLRRTHGTTITGLGFGRDIMNRIQSHREGGIADVYDQHKYAEETKCVMEAVASKIMALAEGRSDAKVVPIRR